MESCHPKVSQKLKRTLKNKIAAQSSGISKVPTRRSLRLQRTTPNLLSKISEPVGIPKVCTDHLPLPSQQQETTSRKRKFNHSNHDVSTSPEKRRKDDIIHWQETGKWPKSLSSANMSFPLPISSTSSFCRKRSIGGTTISNRDSYAGRDYEKRLNLNHIYLTDADCGLCDADVHKIQNLNTKDVELPIDSRFGDSYYNRIIKSCLDRNEAWVMFAIGPIVCPLATQLFATGILKEEWLRDGLNEPWSASKSITSTRPQPDYSVGYSLRAFETDSDNSICVLLETDETLSSVCHASSDILFPFFTAEAKTGDSALDVADKQNAHSMAVAMRGVFELFKLIGREHELNNRVLAFSISFNGKEVRLYCHYIIVHGEIAKCYRHEIDNFLLATVNSSKRHQTYRVCRQYLQGVGTWIFEISQIGVDRAGRGRVFFGVD